MPTERRRAGAHHLQSVSASAAQLVLGHAVAVIADPETNLLASAVQEQPDVLGVAVTRGIDDGLPRDPDDVLALLRTELGRVLAIVDRNPHVDLYPEASRDLVRHLAKRRVERRRAGSGEVDDHSSRGGDRTARRQRQWVLGSKFGREPLSLERDEGEVLSQAVVELAGDALALDRQGGCGDRAPRLSKPAYRCRQQEAVGRQPEALTRGHPIRGHRGQDHVLEPGRGEQERRAAEDAGVALGARTERRARY